MTVFSVAASERHFIDHLLPIWRALKPEERGGFYTRPSTWEHARSLGAHELQKATREHGDKVLVSALGDLRHMRAAKLRTVYAPHGIGLSYHGNGLSLGTDPIGLERKWIDLYLASNEWMASTYRRIQPETPTVVVGNPFVDELLQIPRQSDGSTVAISFHWDCRLVPEMKWALPHYKKALQHLAQTKRWRLLGHGHPRSWTVFKRYWEQIGVEPVEDFREVARRADVYVVDNSSTLYEFAALDRPVVVLNAPWFRRDVNHGLRFWDHADVGLQVDDPRKLEDTIADAFADPDPVRQRRLAAVEAVFPNRQQTAAVAVQAMRQHT